MAPLSPIFSTAITSRNLLSPSACKTYGLGYGVFVFGLCVCLTAALTSFSAFAEEASSVLPEMPSTQRSPKEKTELPIAMPAIAVEAPIASQHWVIAIPGGVPASQPLDTPQRWVLRVLPNAADGSDASVVMGAQEILRYRASLNGQTAYERAMASAAILKTLMDKASTPQQLRNSLKIAILDGKSVLMLGSSVVATADDTTAQAAQMPPAQLASVWQGYVHKALTPSWEPLTPLPKLVMKPTPTSKAPVSGVAKYPAAKAVSKSTPKAPVKATATITPSSKSVPSKVSVANPLMPEALTVTEPTPAPSVSATRQAILAQMMSQQASEEASDSAALTESSSALLPKKAFAKKDFQSAPRLGESTSTFFKPLETPTVMQTGMASWYGDRFHGRKTSSGQRFDMHGYTAAHRTLPFGTKLRVTNLANGRSVMVTVNDRGPFGHGRIIDLSKAAARDIGLMSMGVARVSLAKMPKFSPKLAPKLLPKKLAMLP